MQDIEQKAWDAGYSIPELWGFTAPVTRATSEVRGDHLLLWGILGIVEYQVDRGAGHRYLRDRLGREEWIAYGYRDEPTASGLERVPAFPDAKFGRKRSAIGNGLEVFHTVRIVHADLLEQFAW